MATSRTMYRGSTLTLNLAVTNSDGTPRNITSALFEMTAKKNQDDLDASALFISRVFTITNASGGLATLTVPASATSSVTTFPATLAPVYYDIKIQESGGNIYTLENGLLSILPDVNRSVV